MIFLANGEVELDFYKYFFISQIRSKRFFNEYISNDESRCAFVNYFLFNGQNNSGFFKINVQSTKKVSDLELFFPKGFINILLKRLKKKHYFLFNKKKIK